MASTVLESLRGFVVGLMCSFTLVLCLSSRQEFSVPSITLFCKSSFRGRKIILTDGALSLSLAGFDGRVSSLLVNGGM